MKNGRWLYKTARNGAIDDALYDLETAEQYIEMRRRMDKDGVDVVVWHEMLHEASKEAAATAERNRDRRCENPEDELLNEDGTPMFEPEFDEWNLPEDVMASMGPQFNAAKTDGGKSV